MVVYLYRIIKKVKNKTNSFLPLSYSMNSVFPLLFTSSLAKIPRKGGAYGAHHVQSYLHN